MKKLIAAPVAAGVALARSSLGVEGNVAVVGLSPVSLDVAVLDINDGVVQVASVGGTTHLGGGDWDERIVAWLVDEFRVREDVDLLEDPVAGARLREAAERAREALLSAETTRIEVPYIAFGSGGPKSLDVELTRSTLDDLTAELVYACRVPLQQTLDDAGGRRIDHAVLVGRSARMPAFESLVATETGQEPRKLTAAEIVAEGACVVAAVRAGEVNDLLLLDVIPLTLAIELHDGTVLPLIERNTTIPTRRAVLLAAAGDEQRSTVVHVVEGESGLSAENRSLGWFELELQPGGRGDPNIEVVVDVDAVGTITISATDRPGRITQSMTIDEATLADARRERPSVTGRGLAAARPSAERA